jgi:hypothetical protein
MKEQSLRKMRRPFSRRTFIGWGMATLAGWLSGCSIDATPTAATVLETSFTPPKASDTSTPVSTATPASTPSPAPTATPLPPTYTPVPPTPTDPPPVTVATNTAPPPSLNRGELMRHWPEAETSRVVLVRHAGVWNADTPDPAIVLQMLDAGLTTLTGATDALAVWQTLFDPDDRVLLKVNCIAYGGPTQPAVTYAVAQRLQAAGLRPANILIFDRTDHELEAAGYTLNAGADGLQCHGTRGTGSEAVLEQATVNFYQEIDACDAIINLPIPKQHGGAGISLSMKNHYGSVNRPGALHGGRCDPAIAQLNAQPNLRDKTRLIVGAALNVSPSDWNRPERENALLLSFDPVALDTVGRDILVRHRQALGMDSRGLIEGAPQLNTAQSLGLGATDAVKIDLREVTL